MEMHDDDDWLAGSARRPPPTPPAPPLQQHFVPSPQHSLSPPHQISPPSAIISPHHAALPTSIYPFNHSSSLSVAQQSSASSSSSSSHLPSPGSDSKQKTHRPSVKSHEPEMIHRLRDACMKRVEEKRKSLLSSLRQSSAKEGSKHADQELRDSLKDIIRGEHEMLAMAPGSAAASSSSSSAVPVSPEFVIHKGKGPAISSLAMDDDDLMDAYRDWDPEALDEFDDELYEQILQDMEESIRRHEIIPDQEFDRHTEEEEKALREAFELLSEFQVANFSDDVVVPCPVCKNHKLSKTGHNIYCACGGLNMYMGQDYVPMGVIFKQLSDTIYEHNTSCEVVLEFGQTKDFGQDFLKARCSTCGYSKIIF